MKYKVKDKISIGVKTDEAGLKRLSVDKESKSKQTFLIVSISEVMQTYMIVIDDDMVGWNLSEWHIKNYKLDSALLGKKFYDITDHYVIEKSK